MWILEKDFRFEASHQLPYHDGKCKRLHGHSWKMTVKVECDAIQTEGSKQGMVMDYGDLKKIVQPLVDEKLDHWHLNDTTGLESPTSELLAQWIYQQLEGKFASPAFLLSITIEETCTARCTYHKRSNR